MKHQRAGEVASVHAIQAENVQVNIGAQRRICPPMAITAVKALRTLQSAFGHAVAASASAQWQTRHGADAQLGGYRAWRACPRRSNRSSDESAPSGKVDRSRWMAQSFILRARQQAQKRLSKRSSNDDAVGSEGLQTVAPEPVATQI
jgi:hypothetical protein